jgi:hypothetical protein
VSVRAVERYAARGKLTVRYVGDAPRRADYDEAEVCRLKKEMDGRALPAHPAPSLARRRTLSLDEAATLSGLAREALLHSILAGRLAARVTTAGYSVRLEELEEFAQTL